MNNFASLSGAEKAKVDSKLSELRNRTGIQWNYSLMQVPGESKASPLLEITVDGRISRPISIPRTVESAGDAVCEELENHARKLKGQRMS